MKQSVSVKSGPGVSELNKVLEDIDALGTALRNLSHWLHPPPLRYLGIGPALKELLEGFRKSSGIRTDVTVPADMPRLPDDIELCIFRITQECLQNVAKHAGADKARIVLEHTPTQIRLTVADSGHGFIRSAAIRKGGLGLLSMEERALSVRGRLDIITSPGDGTEVRLTIPVPEDWLPLAAE
jgi:signal transduction histidine kinase